MKTINRSAVIIRKKAPFLSWVKSLPDHELVEGLNLEEINDEDSIYFFPDFESLEELEDCLEENCEMIFEHQMEEWWTEEDEWEKNLSWDNFKDWFDYSFCSMPLDLVYDENLIAEDYQ